jgi:hypothetical protein
LNTTKTKGNYSLGDVIIYVGQKVGHTMYHMSQPLAQKLGDDDRRRNFEILAGERLEVLIGPNQAQVVLKRSTSSTVLCFLQTQAKKRTDFALAPNGVNAIFSFSK